MTTVSAINLLCAMVALVWVLSDTPREDLKIILPVSAAAFLLIGWMSYSLYQHHGLPKTFYVVLGILSIGAMVACFLKAREAVADGERAMAVVSLLNGVITAGMSWFLLSGRAAVFLAKVKPV